MPSRDLGWVLLALGGSALVVGCGGRSGVSLEDEQARRAALGLDDPSPTPEECEFDDECVQGERCIGSRCQVKACDGEATRCVDGDLEVCDPNDLEWYFAEECEWGCLTTSTGGFCGGSPGVCVPNQIFCDDNTLMTCSADGRELVAIEECSDGFVCAEDGVPGCRRGTCEPSAGYCEGGLALRCNAQGTSFVSIVDCAGSVCVDGECRPKICESGEVTCENNTVALCSLDGTELISLDTCGAGETCVDGNPNCQIQVCEPNQSFCDGNSPAVCDALGTGYDTGPSCGTLICSDGVCTDSILFYEGFEDGTYSGWTFAGNGYSLGITSLESAAGSARSLVLGGGNRSHYDSVQRTFSPGLVPSSVAYFARQDTTDSGTDFTLHDATSGYLPETNEIAFVWFRSNGLITIGLGDSAVGVASYVPGQWYEIELVFDWPNQRYDIYVDGVLARADNEFRATSTMTSIQALNLYHFGDSVGYWDEIVFR